MLTVARIKAETRVGFHADNMTRGLYLAVAKGGSKSFVYRYQLNGNRRWLGLGSVREVTLAEARDAATEARKQVRNGVDPVAVKHDQTAAAMAAAAKAKTFDEVFALCVAAKESGWRDPTNAQKWRNTWRDYVAPRIGSLPIDRIETGHITSVLQPIWTTKNETASRVRQRMETTLDFGKTHGWRTGDNPARWSGHLENVLAKPSDVAPRKNMKALPDADLPAFMTELAARDGLAARALEFTILTCARTEETLGAVWGEFDLAAKLWTVPPERIKAKRQHRVPLTAAALAGLPPAGAPDERVFPGLADSAMRDVLTRMGVKDDVDVHGFRATFKTWAAERGEDRDRTELAMAHKVGTAVERRYMRGDMFALRRELAERWARFCTMPAAPEGDRVVPIRRA